MLKHQFTILIKCMDHISKTQKLKTTDLNVEISLVSIVFAWKMEMKKIFWFLLNVKVKNVS